MVSGLGAQVSPDSAPGILKVWGKLRGRSISEVYVAFHQERYSGGELRETDPLKSVHIDQQQGSRCVPRSLLTNTLPSSWAAKHPDASS